MAPDSGPLMFPHDAAPDGGTTIEVAPGIHWLRMPLPFALDHINLWLLEDGDGWTIVDCGIARDETKELWGRHFDAKALKGPRGAKRVIVTHFHPDHVGLAGWLCQELGAELWMTQTEWLMAQALSIDERNHVHGSRVDFYRSHGMTEEWLSQFADRGEPYRTRVAPVPSVFRRLQAGERIDIGGREWEVLIGRGHAPEHACLYSAEAGVLISGDIVLPKITPNVSVWPSQPEADPLGEYLGCLDQFFDLPADTLVLPSHRLPFRGLHARVQALKDHHDDRLADVVGALDRPRPAAEILPVLFRRKLDLHQLGFAIGEAIAHLAYLHHRGRIRRERRADGVFVYSA
ncbi:MBL fold metallo-hydrolase [Allostella vacuolata]|nr:MBL fold metallo-hydrolase [Stella vacuolata]